ncbi:ComF family protein [Antarcticibacterium flavum]|uniref:ComF family protein n=1 Tax=Antarcticibacterium flavum TaxID=2058175 RepID=A0A5B7X3G5_9FLAO|nr:MULTISPECIES: ComF family protein [Antarcticibacterium]MCM4160558.1 amidophosphoribosyltransferase [Antarcticibacterium sp. W02-3]QCY69780.1 ComF family protein [Antarcticibacterium flavum]
MFHDLINLFYPRLCSICEQELVKNEPVICAKCIHDLPVTTYHLNNENPVKKVFYGRVEVENATALLEFHKKSGVQKLIHQLKYKGQQEIGTFLGQWMAAQILENSTFPGVEMVIPVPLHRKKLKHRGYNQVEKFGREISLALQMPYIDTALVKKSFSSTQTIKARLARWGNMEESFVLADPGVVANRHILLVDDIITTGATLEACASVLKEAGGVKISVATMAIAW